MAIEPQRALVRDWLKAHACHGEDPLEMATLDALATSEGGPARSPRGANHTITNHTAPAPRGALPPPPTVPRAVRGQTSTRAVLLAWRQRTLEARLHPTPRIFTWAAAVQPSAPSTKGTAERWRARRAPEWTSAPVERREGLRAVARSLMGQQLWPRGNETSGMQRSATPGSGRTATDLLRGWWLRRDRIELQSALLRWIARHR